MHSVPEIYNGPAKNMTDQHQYNLLKGTCPYLATEGLNETKSCCNRDQLDSLKNQLLTAMTLFGQCPACVRNYRDLFCEMTCSPNQSTFFDYDLFLPSNYYLTQGFAQGLFDSCRDVLYPGTGEKVIELMCGGISGDGCTKEKFLEFVGSPGNGSPFRIRYIFYHNANQF